MSRKALLIQTLIATVLWALGMVFLFGKTFEEIGPTVLVFAALYWGIGRLIGKFMPKGKQE